MDVTDTCHMSVNIAVLSACMFETVERISAIRRKCNRAAYLCVLRGTILPLFGIRTGYLIDVGAFSPENAWELISTFVNTCKSAATAIVPPELTESFRNQCDNISIMSAQGQLFIINRCLLAAKQTAEWVPLVVDASAEQTNPVAITCPTALHRWQRWLLEDVAGLIAFMSERSNVSDEFVSHSDMVALCAWLLDYPIIYTLTSNPAKDSTTAMTSTSNCLANQPLYLHDCCFHFTGSPHDAFDATFAFSCPLTAATTDESDASTREGYIQAMHKWTTLMKSRLEQFAVGTLGEEGGQCKFTLSRRVVVSDAVAL